MEVGGPAAVITSTASGLGSNILRDAATRYWGCASSPIMVGASISASACT